MQMQNPVVSIVLDKRRIKSNGLYPVKLRVFCSKPRKQKLYSTTLEFNEKDFKSIWESSKPRGEHKASRQKLIALEAKANSDIATLKRFSYEAFESVFFNQSTSGQSAVISVFKTLEAEKKRLGAISTEEKYRLARRKLNQFIAYKIRGEFSDGMTDENISFEEVNKAFLEEFKTYCEDINGLSVATAAIYLRNLRTVFNRGIRNGLAAKDDYPFGKDGFSIPTSSKINKALSEDELKRLWHFKPTNEDQAIAKDFWFFSYYSYGINTKDICELKYSALSQTEFVYVRAKTRTTKKERTQKTVALNNSLREIINRRKDDKSEYVFGILSPNDTPSSKHKKIKSFNSFINKHFREFALQVGIDPNLANQLGTYHARHSFATNAVLKGASTALVSEILHDGNLAVTASYLNSFSKKSYQDLSNDLEL
jgi:site-specific recombinase XerD